MCQLSDIVILETEKTVGISRTIRGRKNGFGFLPLCVMNVQVCEFRLLYIIKILTYTLCVLSHVDEKPYKSTKKDPPFVKRNNHMLLFHRHKWKYVGLDFQIFGDRI